MSSVGVEEFVVRLNEVLGNRSRRGANNDYVMVGDLRQAITEALVPPGEQNPEFPKMLFKHGSRSETLVVRDSAEESAARQQGYQREPGPQFEIGYPQQWIECGKVWDWRTVRLNSSEEKRLFEAITDPDDWAEDDFQRGGRGVSLDALIEERREMLRQAISREPLLPSDAPAIEEAIPERDIEVKQA